MIEDLVGKLALQPERADHEADLQSTRIPSKTQPLLYAREIVLLAIEDLFVDGLHVKVHVLEETPLNDFGTPELDRTAPEADRRPNEEAEYEAHNNNTREGDRILPGEDPTTTELGLVRERMVEGVHDDVRGAAGSLPVDAQATLVGEIVPGEQGIDEVALDTCEASRTNASVPPRFASQYLADWTHGSARCQKEGYS